MENIALNKKIKNYTNGPGNWFSYFAVTATMAPPATHATAGSANVIKHSPAQLNQLNAQENI